MSSLCSMCGSQDETVSDILYGYPELEKETQCGRSGGSKVKVVPLVV